MNGALQIAVDLELGEIRLGSERVRLLPVVRDIFCLNDARGPLVRALRFDERSTLLADASDQDVAARIAETALVSSGDAPDAVRVAASLALAGGGENAPSFPACVQFVEQRYGWDAQRVGETMALVIDKMCAEVGQMESNGWKQIVFQSSEADLGALISQMVTNLSQRAAVASDLKVNAETETTDRKQIQSPSPQPTPSVNNYHFEPSRQSSASHGSMQSVSSVSDGKRVAARVLALNKDLRGPEPEPVVPPTVPAKQKQVAGQHERRPVPMPATTPTTLPETEFAPIVKPRPSHVSSSLTQAAAPARIEPSPVLTPAASFPAWQPFASPSSNTQPAPATLETTRPASYPWSEPGRVTTHTTSEPVRLNSRGYGVAVTEPQSAQDWLAELAQLLEAECDMRGIDP
jgi:hypothetical protein